jgi:hypothetical protein
MIGSHRPLGEGLGVRVKPQSIKSVLTRLSQTRAKENAQLNLGMPSIKGSITMPESMN